MEEPDLSGLVMAALARTMTPEKVEAMVSEAVDRLVAASIREAFEWGDTRKQIKAAIGDSLRVSSLDIPAYGDLIRGLVRKAVEARVSGAVAAKLAEDMDEILSLAPKTAKLSELVAVVLEEAKESASIECDCPGEVRIWLLVEDRGHGYRHIYLHPGPAPTDKYTGRSVKHSAAYRFDLTPEGVIYHASIRGHDPKAGGLLGRLYKSDALIRAYYACGTVIEVDEEFCVTEWDPYD